MNLSDAEILSLPIAYEPRDEGWYYVQWVPTEFPVRVWLWEGGELWGWNPNDDPETVKATANDNGVAIANIRWRKEL
ncbi:hypothetical protein EGJ58_13145 [Brucella anthropi]|nr:hypothetical protein EGJ58_13145 [Brucella anthropi]